MTNKLSNIPVKTLIKQDSVKTMINNSLHDKAPQFMTSVVSIVNESKALQNVDQMSVIQSAMIATSLNLPINQNLGFMWLVPYKGKAQAQLGYKGYIQLAIRTGQYKSLNAVAVHEGELKSWNALTEEFDFDPASKVSDDVIGYAGFFKLTNGFSKTVYWTKEQMDEHKKRFSKAGKNSPWTTDYDAMAIKTVIRNLISKWGIMSTELQTALTHDSEEPAEEVTTNSNDEKPETVGDLFDEPKEVEAETVEEEQKEENKQDKKDIDVDKLMADMKANNGEQKEVTDDGNEGNEENEQESLFDNIQDIPADR